MDFSLDTLPPVKIVLFSNNFRLMFSSDHKKVKYVHTLGTGRYGNVYPYDEEKYLNKWVIKRVTTEDPTRNILSHQ